ncbi:hypothetical protein HLB23_03785 [Nocardia uniformis]|uniref:Uncharacterized protein n=1 Tax=Nocardia uniformis TaxID=53432 RepID=A0A849BQM5_9NOCA|nr:hypothetical protein [Nocardia uniformis]NNH69002.1 hypothetical protein [Nocardia uniformis]
MWSAEPGISLTGSEGTLIRATRESVFIADEFGVSEAYAGFEQALPSDVADRMRKDQSKYDFPQEVGTYRYHLAAIKDDGHQLSGLVCSQVSGVATKLNNGKYERTVFKPGSSFTVALERIGDTGPTTPATPTSPSMTPAVEPTYTPGPTEWSAPTVDLFTGWRVLFGVERDDPFQGEYVERCRAWDDIVFPDLPAEVGQRLVENEPPPTLPAYPGY